MAAKAGRASAVVDVFISYAREDRDRAMVLVDALERADREEWWKSVVHAFFTATRRSDIASTHRRLIVAINARGHTQCCVR